LINPTNNFSTMPYKRTNWTVSEIQRALSNPTHSESGPHAHSSKHAVSGELAQNPQFQKARTTAVIHDGRQKDSNLAAQQALGNQKAAGTLSNTQYKKQMAQVPLPSAEVGKHSTLNDVATANALLRVFNDSSMQPHLGTLDAGSDLKVHVNFSGNIGSGHVHETGQPSRPASFKSLFVYLKPNPGNADIPIFQTVVPSEQHKAGGNDPILTIV
jgi:hypothetical protein